MLGGGGQRQNGRPCRSKTQDTIPAGPFATVNREMSTPPMSVALRWNHGLDRSNGGGGVGDLGDLEFAGAAGGRSRYSRHRGSAHASSSMYDVGVVLWACVTRQVGWRGGPGRRRRTLAREDSFFDRW